MCFIKWIMSDWKLRPEWFNTLSCHLTGSVIHHLQFNKLHHKTLSLPVKQTSHATINMELNYTVWLPQSNRLQQSTAYFPKLTISVAKVDVRRCVHFHQIGGRNILINKFQRRSCLQTIITLNFSYFKQNIQDKILERKWNIFPHNNMQACRNITLNIGRVAHFRSRVFSLTSASTRMLRFIRKNLKTVLMQDSSLYFRHGWHFSVHQKWLRL